METSEKIKEIVKERYGAAAHQSKSENENSCCGAGGCSTVDYSVFAEDYSKLKGYTAEADLGLGCGLPTEYARIREEDIVVDLGSGAGNDCFVARAIVGESGKVVGIDMTEAMIEKARKNADALGFNNVEFRLGEIENIPMASNRADVVISNCVLNLVPDKLQAFKETFRILKPGGHFSISDVVIKGELPQGIKSDAVMYAGCVSGAIPLAEYLNIIRSVGFKGVVIQKEKEIKLPDEVLKNYMSEEELTNYKSSGTGIYSITVYAEKPCC
jgi:arsenite methyltransferase